MFRNDNHKFFSLLSLQDKRAEHMKQHETCKTIPKNTQFLVQHPLRNIQRVKTLEIFNYRETKAFETNLEVGKETMMNVSTTYLLRSAA